MYWIKKYFSSPQVHVHSIYEVVVTSIFSLLPFFVVYFAKIAQEIRVDDSYTLLSLFSRGQIFLLAYGVFGAVFWLAFVRSDRPRHGARIFLGFISTILIFPIIGYIGVDPTFSTIVNNTAIKFGFFLYASLLVINYLLLFYMHIEPPSAADVLAREASDMRKDYEEYTRGNG